MNGGVNVYTRFTNGIIMTRIRIRESVVMEYIRNKGERENIITTLCLKNRDEKFKYFSPFQFLRS